MTGRPMAPRSLRAEARGDSTRDRGPGAGHPRAPTLSGLEQPHSARIHRLRRARPVPRGERVRRRLTAVLGLRRGLYARRGSRRGQVAGRGGNGSTWRRVSRIRRRPNPRSAAALSGFPREPSLELKPVGLRAETREHGHQAEPNTEEEEELPGDAQLHQLSLALEELTE